jgi:hypothetical protein
MFANRFQEIQSIYLCATRIFNSVQSVKGVSVPSQFRYKHKSTSTTEQRNTQARMI